MTAPLPPLPEPRRRAVFATSKNTDSVRKGFEMGGYEKEPPMFDELQMEAYAKLAVREALLGLIRKSISHNWVEPSDDGNIVTIPESVLRAMIEEYTND